MSKQQSVKGKQNIQKNTVQRQQQQRRQQRTYVYLYV